MHAIKIYSGFNSDDEDDEKKRRKKTSEEKVKHGRSSSKYERTKGGYSEHKKKSASSHSERSSSKLPKQLPEQEGEAPHCTSSDKKYEKKSAPSHSVKTKGQQPVPSRSEKSAEKSEVTRSRSQSPVKKKFQAEHQEPVICQGIQDHAAIPALLQAKTAGALLTAQLGQVPYLQAHLKQSKLKSVEEKRKKLWSAKKKTVSSQSQWEQAKFSDGDGQTQAKFRRLMGMGSGPAQVDGGTDAGMAQDKHTRTLKNLEHQYESSRYLTHMARGSGLGYGYSSTSDYTDVEK